MSSDPQCTVAECFDEGEWIVDFERALSSQEFDRWLNLQEHLQNFHLDFSVSNSVIWALDKSKWFTTKSLYGFLSNGG